ncbi:centrosomal protein of 89 kDa [Nomia melanderi]|uniref:centrosomal protein of 89 kDa n=1 Tax=Nomia melanderi TaxID=2448451 RepID=UPI00130457A6|nr:centrosomal protein of 89 kDa-like isoform X2 [Nomia melanderi]XP_031845097.1 centrosomal protein of 89 kDa-like isoform X2 [Nomia melanderi]
MSVSRSCSEIAYKPVYCRRRTSRARHSLTTHNGHKEPTDHVTDNGNDHEGDTPLRSRSKKSGRCRRINEEKDVEKHPVDEADADSSIISTRMKDKHVSKGTLKIANDYHKLEKRYKHVKDEYEMLNRLMEQREAEFQKACLHYEEMVQELENDRVELINRNQKLEAEKSQSKEDIHLLKSIVYQLNTELERYQDKLANGKHKTIGTENKGERCNERVWSGINFHALGPLLNAYQENLSEKRELINMYEQNMANFGNRCKEILTENELMHQEVKELRSECDRYAKELRTTIENTAMLRKQNDFLQKETRDTKQDANELRSSYESKIKVLLEQNEILKTEHAASMSQLSNLKGKYEVLNEEFEKVKHEEKQTVPMSAHTAAIDECKTLLDELKYRYENEKRTLSNQIKRIEENQPENEKQLVMTTAERNHLKSLVTNLEANLKRTLRKNEYLRSVSYSTRVSRDSVREQLSKATAYCGELFTEYERIVSEREKLLALLRETEKENASIDRLGKSISSRVAGLKDQLESVRRGARQQVETVQKRIQLQEVRVRKMKREYRRKVRQLREAIKQKDETIASLQETAVSRNKSTRQLPRATSDEKPTAAPSKESHNP